MEYSARKRKDPFGGGEGDQNMDYHFGMYQMKRQWLDIWFNSYPSVKKKIPFVDYGRYLVDLCVLNDTERR